jgi:hypothetical protein
MQRATITIHLPTHRREALRAYGESWRMLDEIYDGNIGSYVDFLRRQGRELGFDVRTDQRETNPVFTIDERNRAEKKKAYEWLEGLPDLWEWIT